MRHYNLFWIFIPMFSFFVNVSESAKHDELILGEWYVETVDLSQAIAAIPEDEQESLMPTFKEIGDGLLTMKWVFKPNGEFTEVFRETSEEGTWHLTPDKIGISIIIDEDIQDYSIVTIDKNRLVVSADLVIGTIFIHFKKKK